MEPRTSDRFGLSSDEELQLSTLRAGWRFYERTVGRDYEQQALAECIDAMESILDLGVKPSHLIEYKARLTKVEGRAKADELASRIRTLSAMLNQRPLSDVRDSVRALLQKHGRRAEHPIAGNESVATDVGFGARAATHVSKRLRDAA